MKKFAKTATTVKVAGIGKAPAPVKGDKPQKTTGKSKLEVTAAQVSNSNLTFHVVQAFTTCTRWLSQYH